MSENENSTIDVVQERVRLMDIIEQQKISLANFLECMNIENSKENENG